MRILTEGRAKPTGFLDRACESSLTVEADDYEAFRAAASVRGGSIALLIREAMRFFREHRRGASERLQDVPVLLGHRPLGTLPDRLSLHDEISDRAVAPERLSVARAGEKLP